MIPKKKLSEMSNKELNLAVSKIKNAGESTDWFEHGRCIELLDLILKEYVEVNISKGFSGQCYLTTRWHNGDVSTNSLEKSIIHAFLIDFGKGKYE